MVRILSNKRIVDVDERGRATFETCSWLVNVPTASLHPAPAPEDDPNGEWEPWYPDFPSDVYTAVECGARITSLDGTLEHTTCDNGHAHHTYGSPEWEADTREFEASHR